MKVKEELNVLRRQLSNWSYGITRNEQERRGSTGKELEMFSKVAIRFSQFEKEMETIRKNGWICARCNYNVC